MQMIAPNASQALQKMSQILQRDSQSLIAFEQHTYVMMFVHYSRRNWRHWQLSPSWDMLAIHFISHLSFLDNFRIAMLMEAIGVGPQCYCICFDPSSDTYRKLKLFLYSLQQEKIFIYPIDARLECPFLHEPDRKSTRLNSSHSGESRMPSSA